RQSDSSPAAAHWTKTRNKLARVFVFQSGLEPDLWRARSRRTIELVGIRRSRGDAGDRCFPFGCHGNSPLVIAKSSGQYSIPFAEEHSDSCGHFVLVSLCTARDCIADSGLSGRNTGLS